MHYLEHETPPQIPNFSLLSSSSNSNIVCKIQKIGDGFRFAPTHDALTFRWCSSEWWVRGCHLLEGLQEVLDHRNQSIVMWSLLNLAATNKSCLMCRMIEVVDGCVSAASRHEWLSCKRDEPGREVLKSLSTKTGRYTEGQPSRNKESVLEKREKLEYLLSSSKFAVRLTPWICYFEGLVNSATLFLSWQKEINESIGSVPSDSKVVLQGSRCWRHEKKWNLSG